MLQRTWLFNRINIRAPLANGLVFAGLAPGGLVGSTLYLDSSLYQNNGTLTNMDASNWIFDQKLGRFACAFNGSDERIILKATPNITGDFTVALWMYPISTAAWQGLFGQSADQLIFVTSGTGLYFKGGGSDWNRPSIISTDTWIHLAFQVQGTTWRYSLNGASWVEASKSSIPWTNAAQIGYAEGLFFGGNVSDVLLWNNAISHSSIQQLADPSNTLLSGLILPPRRKWWPVASGTPAAFKPAWARNANTLLSGGVTSV